LSNIKEDENSNTESKKVLKKIGKKDEQNSKSIVNMIMEYGYNSKRSQVIAIDTETLVSQTQDRMWKALKRRYQYDSTVKPGQDFLLNYVNSKVSLVIMYADLVGSTNMSMTLPVDKMVTIVRAFSYEISSIVQSHGGYVLKYVGDAVIAFYTSGYNNLLSCDKAVHCGSSIITVIKNGINPILNQYDYPELSVKIGIDEGENVIVQYGHDRSSLIDILGYCMSVSAKITSLTDPDKITVGEDVYNVLHPQMKKKFRELIYNRQDWRYTNRHTGRLYELYVMQG
jgi:adenylate cyclase